MTGLYRCVCLGILLFLMGEHARAVTTHSPDHSQQNRKPDFKFSFGTQPRRGFIEAPVDLIYNPQRGYGFMSPTDLQAHARSVCGGNKPFLFSVDVPEGNYDVTFALGDSEGESITTVKGEARRLFVERLHLPRDRFEKQSFTINVRYKELANGTAVHLKKDEENDFDWDHRLTFEFNDTHPCISSLEIKRNERAVTVYVAGDSTVTDQRREPWAAWGQMLPRFFGPGMAIANHAESGESLKSFIGENRLAKILETIKAGDYLFVQFAHNDQKPGPSHVDAFTSYKEYLQRYIREATKHGAIPVLVTSMHRRRFDAQGKIINTLEDYPEAMRQTAKEQNIAVIDLNSMSKTLFEALGPAGTLKAFVHFPAHTFPGQDEELKDDTHFNDYGAYELARCMIEGIKQRNPGLSRYLRDDSLRFDPAHPDPVSEWKLPQSPSVIEQKPEAH